MRDSIEDKFLKFQEEFLEVAQARPEIARLSVMFGHTDFHRTWLVQLSDGRSKGKVLLSPAHVTNGSASEAVAAAYLDFRRDESVGSGRA